MCRGRCVGGCGVGGRVTLVIRACKCCCVLLNNATATITITINRRRKKKIT